MTLNTDRQFTRRKEGMSLLEIIIVIGIISVLTAFIVGKLAGVGDRAEERLVRLAVESGFETSLKEFQIDMRRYPTTEEGLTVLMTRPANDSGRWRGPYIEKEEMLYDSWGREFKYRYPGTRNTKRYDLYSLGEDGVESDDDIGNW
ncbi:MAG: type II secretion system major pseudopilin GspG [Verrucomicrobiota bacterium]